MHHVIIKIPPVCLVSQFYCKQDGIGPHSLLCSVSPSIASHTYHNPVGPLTRVVVRRYLLFGEETWS